jgi:carboxypeptidase D
MTIIQILKNANEAQKMKNTIGTLYRYMHTHKHNMNVLHHVIIGLIALLSVAQAYRRLPDEHSQSVSNAHYDVRQEEPSKEEILETIAHHNRHLQSPINSEYLPKPNDHLVTSLPYLNPKDFTTKHYAGHIPASPDDDKKFFYWLFEPDTTSSTDPNIQDKDIPLVIWLNGGPGCSSMDGLFLENGPLRLVPPAGSHSDWTIQTNDYSWHKAPAYMLYIDQPVGTGLSFTKKKTYCKNDQEVNIDFFFFLQNFLQVYADTFVMESEGRKRMNRPLFFSGESHAGHYIPSMMDFILQRNSDTHPNTAPGILIHLGGSAIGNGWTDPVYQYSASDIGYSLGAIDFAQKQALDDKEVECQNKLRKKEYVANVCWSLLDKVIAQTSTSTSKMSVYDNRAREAMHQDRIFPPGHKDVERFLGGWSGHGYPTNMNINYLDVLKALHASESVDAGQRFLECTDPPYEALSHQDGKGVVTEVVNVLNHPDKIRMLFFNGMNDMICNHVGNERYLENLPWNNVQQWITAQRYTWTANGTNPADGPSGYTKEYENLMFLKILNSGHMVRIGFCSFFLIIFIT